MGIIVCPTFEKFWEEKREGKKHLWYQLILLTNTFFFCCLSNFASPYSSAGEGLVLRGAFNQTHPASEVTVLGRVQLEARWEKQPTTGSTCASRGGNLRQNRAWLFSSQQVLNCLPRCIFFFFKHLRWKMSFWKISFYFFKLSCHRRILFALQGARLVNTQKNMKENTLEGISTLRTQTGAVEELLEKVLSNYHDIERTADYWRRDGEIIKLLFLIRRSFRVEQYSTPQLNGLSSFAICKVCHMVRRSHGDKRMTWKGEALSKTLQGEWKNFLSVTFKVAQSDLCSLPIEPVSNRQRLPIDARGNTSFTALWRAAVCENSCYSQSRVNV